MHRLNLYLQQQHAAAYRFVRPDGTVEQIPRVRLMAFANLSQLLVRTEAADEYRITKCIVDTGSHIATIPETIWQHFRPDVVTPLPFAPGTPPAERHLVVAGGRFPFELGELTVRLEDQQRRHLSVALVAQLVRDGGQLQLPLILGLRGGVIDGRTLVAAPDAAAPFAQAWHLEEP